MGTGTASRGKAKGTKPAAEAPKKKRTRKPTGREKSAPLQTAVLASVKAENPLITSEEFAIKFNLPVEEVARHRAFVLQYVIDYDVKAAAMRMGYPEETARDTGDRMLRYCFSQLFLAEVQKAATLETVVTVGQIVSGFWKEANRPDTIIDGCCTSNSSTRLSAYEKLARMHGLLDKKPKEIKVEIRRVMVVGEPNLRNVGASPEEWGKHAVASQKALKAETCIDV